MSKDDHSGDEHPDHDSLNKLLLRLQLPFIRANYHELAQTAAEQQWDHLEYLKRLIEGEIARREDKSLVQRIRRAPLPAHQNPGSVPVELAEEDQPAADPKSLPSELRRTEVQRHLFRRRWLGKNPSVHRAWS
jgi:DNA replication protein DnaC